MLVLIKFVWTMAITNVQCEDCGGSGARTREEYRAHVEEECDISTGAIVLVRCGIWVVVGPSELAHSEWNLPLEDQNQWTEHKHCYQLLNHICVVPVIFDDAVPFQVRCFLVLCGLDCCDDRLRCTFLAGDQRNSSGVYVYNLGPTLVLASLCC